MAFTFQINSNVKFNHNETLLKKADKYKPQIYKKKILAKSIVELIDDRKKLENTGVKEIAPISELASKKFKRDDRVIIDFKQHYVGNFKIHIDQEGSPMDAPLTFKIRFAEMPNELKHDSSEYNGWLSKSWIQEEIIHLDRLPVNLELPRRYSFRYVEISVIDTSPKWFATFSNPQVETQSAVNQSEVKIPDFKDQELSDIYKVGVRTLHDCMQDVFEDGPKRDRRLWLGDLRLQALSNYASFDNVDMVKRCLYLFGAMTTKDGRISANIFTNQLYVPDDTFMYDYSLFFISTLDDLERTHFDREILVDLYPIAKKQWNYIMQYISEDGKVKLDEDYPVFVDWSNDFDKETASQAITIYALKQLIHLGELAQDDVNDYQKTLNSLVSYAKEKLFDKKIGLFVSGEKRELNVASQTWMVLAHVFDDKQNKVIMKKTIKKLFPIKEIATPYMYHHIDHALFEAGMNEEAIKLMKNYWGKMISLGADTYWEAFEPEDPNYSPYGSSIVNSYCHAWSCTPVYLLSKYMNME